jgi:hypothetical protein
MPARLTQEVKKRSDAPDTGVVSLVARIGDSAPLLMLVVCQTAREIEERLFDGPSVHERALQRVFLRARRRARGPLMLVSEDALMCNTGAARLFCEAGSPAAVSRSFEPDENSMKAPEELNKPLELHARDTLDWDPLAELCPGSTGRFGDVM